MCCLNSLCYRVYHANVEIVLPFNLSTLIKLSGMLKVLTQHTFCLIPLQVINKKNGIGNVSVRCVFVAVTVVGLPVRQPHRERFGAMLV